MNSDDSKAHLFSIEEAGRLLGGTSPWTLRKQISRGNIRVTRLGRRVFLDENELSRISRNGLPSLRNNATAEGNSHLDGMNKRAEGVIEESHQNEKG
jgi:hypothetical protein